MGLKEIIAAALMAISSYDAHYQDKPAQQEEDLGKVLEEADKLYERNKPATKDALSDKESAAKMYEKVLKGSGFDKEVATKFVDCCMKVSADKFNLAQRLWEIGMALPEERKTLIEEYKIKNVDQAREIAKPLYKSTSEHLEKVVSLQVRRAEAWQILTISYIRIDEIDKALDAAKIYVRLKPEDAKAYQLLFAIYMEKGTPGAVLDDLAEVNAEDAVKNSRLTEGVNKAYNDFRTRKVIIPLKVDKQEDKRKAAELFYLTSKTQWAEEMKKEKIADRNFSNPLQDCYRAGSMDILAAETAEELHTALNRFEDSFQNINKGLDNGLSTLDKAYFQSVFRAKSLAIVGQDKVMEILKEKYRK